MPPDRDDHSTPESDSDGVGSSDRSGEPEDVCGGNGDTGGDTRHTGGDGDADGGDGSDADRDALERFSGQRQTGPATRGFGAFDDVGAGGDIGGGASSGSAARAAFGGEEPAGSGSLRTRLQRRLPSRVTIVLSVLGLALAAAFLADVFLVRVYFVEAWEWDPTRSDWLFLASLWILLTLATRVAPNRELARRYWDRLRDDRAAVVSLWVLCGFFLLGVVGPLAVGDPQSRFLLGGQPPLFVSVDANSVADCAGTVSDGRCWGSLSFPLGTDTFGYSVATLLVAGARLAVYVATITAAIVVPLGALVGSTAGFYGGRVDALLSRYVDVQQTIPAIVAYVVLVLVIEKSLFMLVLVFGLFSWGGVARVVRAETMQRRNAEYVIAAEGLGGTRRYRLRRHVLPNVSHGVVTAFGQQVPLLLVTEAAIAYLNLNDIDQPSWGTLIANGVASGVVEQWWVAAAGVAALAGTTLAFKLAADALRDALDPTG